MDARGGILEPPGIVEVKYRAPQQAWLLDRLGVPSCNRTRPCMEKKETCSLAIQLKVQGMLLPLRLTNQESEDIWR